MARTKSQKAKRYATQTAHRLALAKYHRELLAREVHYSKSLRKDSTLDQIREGREAVTAQRVRTHAEHITYKANQSDEMRKHTRRNAAPLVRLAVTTREDAKRKISARILQTYIRTARKEGLTRVAAFDWFNKERPLDAQLLNL